MFADIAAKLLELGIFFDKPLHIGDWVDSGRLMKSGSCLVRLNIFFQRSSEFAEGSKVVLIKKGIALTSEQYFLSRKAMNLCFVVTKNRATLSSGRISGTIDRFTRPFCIPRSSWTIAWYVHCVNSGVTGSFLRSAMISTGGLWLARKSNKEVSVSIKCYRSLWVPIEIKLNRVLEVLCQASSPWHSFAHIVLEASS